jgi:hypothetical protein
LWLKAGGTKAEWHLRKGIEGGGDDLDPKSCVVVAKVLYSSAPSAHAQLPDDLKSPMHGRNRVVGQVDRHGRVACAGFPADSQAATGIMNRSSGQPLFDRSFANDGWGENAERGGRRSSIDVLIGSACPNPDPNPQGIEHRQDCRSLRGCPLSYLPSKTGKETGTTSQQRTLQSRQNRKQTSDRDEKHLSGNRLRRSPPRCQGIPGSFSGGVTVSERPDARTVVTELDEADALAGD